MGDSYYQDRRAAYREYQVYATERDKQEDREFAVTLFRMFNAESMLEAPNNINELTFIIGKFREDCVDSYKIDQETLLDPDLGRDYR